MLTPSFELVQDADFLTILIKARYAKVTEVEIFVDGKDFKFYSKPYFLRLHLPGGVVEDGRETAKYDVDSGSFEIRLPKEVPGETFEGLDMLTTLLAPRGQRSTELPRIEITGGNDTTEEHQENAHEQAEEIDWQVEQQPFNQEEDSLWGDTTYGFANKRSGVFQRLQEELCGIVDVSSPDTTQLADRKRTRRDAENDKFDEQHYLADLYQDDCAIDELLSHNPPWHQEWRDLQSKSKQADNQDQVSYADETIVPFTEDEKDQMRCLPKRDHLLDAATERGALLSLVDIIFAYAYNVRTTLSENSVESAWTICKLSSTLSWLEWFSSLDDTVTACYRRALCYPLYRHWKLTNRVYQDVRKIFMLGRRRLLKCLLEIHRILASDEPRYILNELYITDYCVLIQTLSHHRIASLARALKMVKVTKSQVGFELEELEAAAELARQDSSEDGDKQDSAIEDVHQHGYPHILQEGPHREQTAESSDGGSRRDSAVGSVHQHGYPHILQEGLSDKEQTTQTETGTEENNRGDMSADKSAKDKVVNFTDTALCATDVTTKMSNLELGKAENTSDEKQIKTSVLQSEETTELSLEEWSQKPPSHKIEVYGENTDIRSESGDQNKECYASDSKKTDHLRDLTSVSCSLASLELCQETDRKVVEETGGLEHLVEAVCEGKSGSESFCSDKELVFFEKERQSQSGLENDGSVLRTLGSESESESEDSESDSESDLDSSDSEPNLRPDCY